MGSHKTKSSTGASLKAEHITFLRLLLLKVCLNKQTEKKRSQVSIVVIKAVL